MLRYVFATLSATVSSTRLSLHGWKLGRIAIAVLVLAFAVSALSYAQPSPSVQENAEDFFRGIVGEWIGVCEQSTNGEQADNKYFHAVIEQVGRGSFASEFNYYRFDEATGAPLHVGSASVMTTIETDGTVTNEISGEGIMLVDYRPKQQRHELVETLTCAEFGGLTGEISGKISVSGMPFGLGKNGRVYDGTSTWSLDDDILTIRQSLKVGFRILFFTKSFKVTATTTAHRGTDVASLMKPRVAAKTEDDALEG